jgi:hypothetical protein
MVGTLEWEAIKRRTNYKCIICEKSEKTVGKLVQTHLKADSKGGSQIVPMCKNDHGRYDDGDLNDRELNKIGVTRENYNKYRPKKGKKTESKDSVLTTVLKAQDKSIKKVLKAQNDAIKKYRL